MRVGDPVVVEGAGRSWRERGLGLVWALSRRLVFVAWAEPRFDGDCGGAFPRSAVRHVWADPTIGAVSDPAQL